MSFNIDIDRAIEAAIKKLEGLKKEFSPEERKKVLRKAARPIVNAARGNVKDSKKPHYRYSTPKLTTNLKAPKGQGRIEATYYPGNLRRSIRVLDLRESKTAVYVGPKFAKRSLTGDEFGKNSKKVDGYYAAFVEYGTRHSAAKPFMRPAYDTKKGEAIKESIKEFKKNIDDFISKNAI